MSQRIVATDGSNHARHAIEVAADIAARYSAKLSILHVLLLGHVPPDIRELSDKVGAEEPPLAVGGHYIRAELPREIQLDIADKLLAAARKRAEGTVCVTSSASGARGRLQTASSTTPASTMPT